MFHEWTKNSKAGFFREDKSRLIQYRLNCLKYQTTVIMTSASSSLIRKSALSASVVYPTCFFSRKNLHMYNLLFSILS